MQKLRSLLPRGSQSTAASGATTAAAQRQSVSLEPEIGFQISIEANQPNDAAADVYHKPPPELNVNLMAARHLPTLFGFKIVHGYLIKVKLFPGSKRLDSSIQTNSWPKFNENFRFPLAPDIKPSLKHAGARRSSRPSGSNSDEFTPEALFEGQFVVFTVYALLELPPASFNRFNRTYRSLRDKSSNLMQKVVDSSAGLASGGSGGSGAGKSSRDDKENGGGSGQDAGNERGKVRRKPSDLNPRDAMPPLTISESRRNIGSVTCYLEPKLFKRNARTGNYATEELWLPIKDITTTAPKALANNPNNAAKGVVELVMELRDLADDASTASNGSSTVVTTNNNNNYNTADIINGSTDSALSTAAATKPSTGQWNRMTSQMRRKMGLSNARTGEPHALALRVTTARMRCSQKVKDELEATAGSVYVKTTIFEHGIYVDSWKSPHFYPSLSTKWDLGVAGGEQPTLIVPLQCVEQLDNILIRTTLATKTKMAKKLVLGTVVVGAGVRPSNAATASGVTNTGAEHMLLLRQTPLGERVPLWHSYQ